MPAWVEVTRHGVRLALPDYGYAMLPAGLRYVRDRLDDLVYYVPRDYVGEPKLTVPIRDPHLNDVKANEVGERVKAVPRASIGHGGRIPFDLQIDSVYGGAAGHQRGRAPRLDPQQAPEAMTPVDLLQTDALLTELVALLWLTYEDYCVVLFSVPTGAGKTKLMRAHCDELLASVEWPLKNMSANFKHVSWG